jgi:hypothetical protein
METCKITIELGLESEGASLAGNNFAPLQKKGVAEALGTIPIHCRRYCRENATTMYYMYITIVY